MAHTFFVQLPKRADVFICVTTSLSLTRELFEFINGIYSTLARSRSVYCKYSFQVHNANTSAILHEFTFEYREKRVSVHFSIKHMCTYERFGWTLFSAFVVSQNSTDCCDLTVLTVAVINSINCLIENYNSAQFCLACMHILSLQCFQFEGIFFWEWEGKEKLIIITLREQYILRNSRYCTTVAALKFILYIK